MQDLPRIQPLSVPPGIGNHPERALKKEHKTSQVIIVLTVAIILVINSSIDSLEEQVQVAFHSLRCSSVRNGNGHEYRK